MLFITTLLVLARLVASAVDKDLQIKFMTMPLDDFIAYFNKQNFSYNITDYFKDVHRVSGAHFNIHKEYPVYRHDSRLFEDLPENFDARKRWPNCESIKEINNQGHCGSCWTFGTANTASDRTCIHSNKTVHLAEQDFECLQKHVCRGGLVDKAFNFWLKEGLVTRECKPYNITKLRENVCTKECVNKTMNYTQDKHYAKEVYGVSGETIDNIKAELFHNGSIQASFVVYGDFVLYKEGIYEHKFGTCGGGHSVRIIGYGVENNVPYWLVANSWSNEWGEAGHFRVKAFADDIFFESFLFTGMPRT